MNDDDGPACGTAEARTYLLVVFTGDTGPQFSEHRCCCYRHIPRPADVLPARADILEIVIEDAWTRTVVRDGRAEVTVTLPAAG